jgi:DNA-binding transcriptional ArsR family regulator
VRQAIGAWAYSLGAGQRRPSNEDVRAAIGVASAVRELATDSERREWDRERELAVEIPVPEDLSDIAARSGFTTAEIDRALDLLAAARVVTRQIGASAATVSLATEVLIPAPAVAHVDWNAARDRLHAVRGSIAPALAVLRELAMLGGAFDLGAGLPSVRASVRDLESATSYGRSTVSEALAALDDGRLLDVETRAGRTTRFVLRRAIFGLADDAPRAAVVPEGTDIAPSSATRSVSSAGTSDRPGQPATARVLEAPSVSTSGAVALVGTFAGTPIYAPPGTPFVLDRDAHGRWLCRVGPLVLGPVDPQ